MAVRLGVAVELTLRADSDGTARARVWGVSPAVFLRYAREIAAGRWFALSSTGALESWEDDAAPDHRAMGRGTQSSVVARDPTAFDRIAALATRDTMWSFDVAVFDHPPSEDEVNAVGGGVVRRSVTSLPVQASAWFQNGGAELHGPAQPVESAAGRMFLDRIAGSPTRQRLPPELVAAARSTGIVTFRDLIIRGHPTRAQVLHACGFGAVPPLVSKRSLGDAVTATDLAIDADRVAASTAGARPLAEWLGAGTVRLWLARHFGGFARSDDDAWV